MSPSSTERDCVTSPAYMNSRMAVRWAKGTSWREVISTPKDDRQVGGWAIEMIDYLQNDDRMFCRILFQQVFEVRGAGAQNHLVGLGVLALMISLHALQHATGNKGYLGGNGDVAEALLISQVLERGDHVGLEVVPAEAELLVVSHFGQEVV